MDGEVYGPYDLDTLRGIHLTPDILVLSTSPDSRSSSDTWKEASEYPELADSLLIDTIAVEDIPEEMPPTPAPLFNAHSAFYIKRGELPYGPYTLEELAGTSINEDTLVSLDGMSRWYRTGDINGLLLTLAAIAGQMRRSESSPVAEETTGDVTASYRQDCDNKLLAGNMVKSIFEVCDKKKSPYRMVFDTSDEELKFIIGEYNEQFEELLGLIRELIALNRADAFSRNLINLTVDSINTAIDSFNRRFDNEFERVEAKSEEGLSSIQRIGVSSVCFEAPFDGILLKKWLFMDALSESPLMLVYNTDGRCQADEFIDSIVGNLYKDNAPRSICTIVLDLEELTGLSSAFKTLNRDLYRVVSNQSEARDTIRELQAYIGNVIRNLLVEPGMNLRSYNSSHDTKEPHKLLIVKDFPANIHGETLNSLRIIAKNGPRAGVYLALMISEQSVSSWDENARINEEFNLAEFESRSVRFNFLHDRTALLDAFLTDEYPEDGCRVNLPQYNCLSVKDISSIVENVNEQCELRDDVVISLADYLPSGKNLWRSDSGRQVEIPFGLSSDRNIASLKITQESGQNSAVVIGIPGSGKSVFLHSLILNAAFKYSPDELRMYLIDFSGVEFNAYALGGLPHARVIAPEAEREFGISILRELEEEGARRMELCRRYNVNSIVELRRVAPEIKVPRLLVIIDEFQKLFDEGNDKISQEANAKIHIIIQEFRKFGINLVLATQKLPANSLLPRDLIANRVVFKCAPNDFQALIFMENSREMPRLRTGECIYNSESGASYDNTRVQGFFASKQEIDRLLSELSAFADTAVYEKEPIMVFRSGEQPEFNKRRRNEAHMATDGIPVSVPIYFGESIAVNDVDVNVELVKENNNNILVVGGESDVARRIVLHAVLSAISAHEPDSATVVALNGMRADNVQWADVNCALANSPVNYISPRTSAEMVDVLSEIKNEVENRRNDESALQPHIYIAGFDIQALRAFDPDTSGVMAKASAASKLMAFILNNGPAAGVFSILQTDTLAGINRVDARALDACNYRIALQMPENASMKVMDSYAANRLFVFNRPASRFRAYMRDNLRNISIKFKPYK